MSALEITASGEGMYFGHGPIKCSFPATRMGYFAFKHLLRCSDDRSLYLVEKNPRFDGFLDGKPPSSRQGPGVFLCCLYYYEESGRSHTIPARKKAKTIKSMNSLKKTQEYIKGKSPLFIL